MYEDARLGQILDTMEQKLNRAHYMYGFEEDYRWILGEYIYWELASMPELRYRTEDEDAQAYGIPVMMDKKDKWRISLLKEIK
jgi:hypothetical protein